MDDYAKVKLAKNCKPDDKVVVLSEEEYEKMAKRKADKTKHLEKELAKLKEEKIEMDKELAQQKKEK